MWGARRRPFVHPLHAPNGATLTCDAPDDHPWHHGLWFTIKFVNDENFWEEYDEYGVLRHDGPPEVDDRDGRVTITGTVRWIRPDRESVVMDELRRITHRELGGGMYRIDLDTTLVPRADVLLDRTPFSTWGGYGGLTLRGHPRWHDTRLLLSDGSEHEQIHGVPAVWCDVSGSVDGGRAGVTLFDHPDNARHPVPWYASTRAETYGDGWANFVNAAFLWDDALRVSRDEHLRVRHGVLVHDGTWSRDRLDAEYRTYLA